MVEKEGYLKKKLLVIDDEDSIHQIFEKIFEDRYQLFCAKNLKEAKIKTFIAKGIDLVIVDIFLKEETGLEIVRDIRSFGKNLPIIVMSAITDSISKQTLENIQKKFSCSFLKKPIQNEEIFALVDAALREI